jgi:hypothetical protein
MEEPLDLVGVFNLNCTTPVIFIWRWNISHSYGANLVSYFSFIALTVIDR